MSDVEIPTLKQNVRPKEFVRIAPDCTLGEIIDIHVDEGSNRAVGRVLSIRGKPQLDAVGKGKAVGARRRTFEFLNGLIREDKPLEDFDGSMKVVVGTKTRDIDLLARVLDRVSRGRYAIVRES